MDHCCDRGETGPDTQGRGPAVCHTLHGLLYRQLKLRKKVDCRIAPVNTFLLYKRGEFWVRTWVERRMRANFQPPLQAANLRKKELLSAKKIRMLGERKTLVGLQRVFIMPNFSREIFQDSNSNIKTNYRSNKMRTEQGNLSVIHFYPCFDIS